MISVPVRDMSGAELGTYEFDPAELAPDINKQLLHDVVVMYEANRRVGTVRQKSRGEVIGSTKKLYRQKGTGRARMGNRRQPVRVGGGRAFPRRPKDWSYRLPKKAIRLATRMALLSKFQDGEAIVVDSFSVQEPKTRIVAGFLRSLGVDKDSCLLAIQEHDSTVWKSARNIEALRVSVYSDLNAYDLLRQKRLVVTKDAMDRLRGVAG
ncbi:50S ribosomal protein L4 [Maioricimonas rarisocia]|uniref:Large ribosomal subunit protein uL4 n=2 Tax=Maioricimonas rarisocia TaxID=2528026 RepID=A0A517ZBH5_9PLAN|nr:50S ribosomal protein L4 [Maioricimonas rarisocia]